MGRWKWANDRQKPKSLQTNAECVNNGQRSCAQYTVMDFYIRWCGLSQGDAAAATLEILIFIGFCPDWIGVLVALQCNLCTWQTGRRKLARPNVCKRNFILWWTFFDFIKCGTAACALHMCDGCAAIRASYILNIPFACKYSDANDTR